MFFSHLNLVLTIFFAVSVPVHGKCFKRPDENGHVKWPKEKTQIKKNMFKNCEVLKSIDIPAEVEFVDDGAFFKSGLNLVELTAACREKTAGWAERAAEWEERAAEWSERVTELQEKVSERNGRILKLGKRIVALEGRTFELEDRCGDTAPSTSPTLSPTASPTHAPTLSPSNSPTGSPTPFPTASPTNPPTMQCEAPCTSTALVKLPPPAGTSIFGGIAVVGDTLVVGSPDEAAYVFSRKNSGAWEQVQRLVALDGAKSDKFSSDIAFDGNTLLIGAYGAAAETGAAYVFTLQEGLWKEKQKLTAPDGEERDIFGWDVAVHGDTLVVGASNHPYWGKFSGSAYVYSLQGGTWNQTAQLVSSDGAAGDRFGGSVAVSQGFIAVGARFHDQEMYDDAGAVYVYTPDTFGNWTQTSKLLSGGSNFGSSVAVSDDGTLVVGAIYTDAFGSVHVFSCTAAGACTETNKLQATDRASGDQFGFRVAVSCNTIVVGAWRDDKGLGSAYTFTRELAGEWVESSKILPEERKGYFGMNVAVSTHTVAIVNKESAYVKEVCDS